jgi:KilA-N domain
MERKIIVEGIGIHIATMQNEDYINLTDIVRGQGDETLLYSWIRNRNTVEFLGLWEQLNNPAFDSAQFDVFRLAAGLNSFNLSPTKWIENTQAIGIITKAGRGGGTLAHRDIALEFCTWLSPKFKLYFIKEFQRLKEEESQRQSLDWTLKRELTKINYRIHTDAVQDNLIPPTMLKPRRGFIYANEADLLNKALFDMTAKEWQTQNPGKPGNVRDYASVNQLLVLANLESLNAIMLNRGMIGRDRLQLLRETAIQQLLSLTDNPAARRLATSQKPLDDAKAAQALPATTPPKPKS